MYSNTNDSAAKSVAISSTAVATVPARPHRLAAVFAAGLMLGSLALTGCNKSEQEPVIDAALTQPETEKGETVGAAISKPQQAVQGESAGSAGTPVRYNVAAWGAKQVKPIAIDELDKIQATFGKIVSTDQNSLDYASNPATKFRFMADDAAYLDVIDSQKYLELGWYYANPTDTDAEKDTSVAHAKKVYKLSRQLMGDEGGKLVADMLGGQIVKNKVVGEQKVEIAKCEFYSCMLVLAKPKA
jgi:hypothetical protein